MDQDFIDILKKHIRNKEVEIKDDSNLLLDLGLSSLGLYLTVSELEKFYDIKIDYRLFSGVKTVKDLYTIVNNAKNKKNSLIF